MYRIQIENLKKWKSNKKHKPLIIRGARQVGKSYLVRQFAKEAFENFVEINFDKEPEKKAFFLSKNVQEAIQLIEIDSAQKIIPGKTLLFLDEIQAAPEIMPILRYFFEDLPDLHVIAAGSLLDFLLADHSFSMPVGRVEYLFMGPLLFEEFLQANGKKDLAEFLNNYSLDSPIPLPFHETLLKQLRYYFITGGMPAVVSAFVENQDFTTVSKEQSGILQSYLDDFSKYDRKFDISLLRKVFTKLPSLICRRFKYVQLDREEKSAGLAKCLDLLELAGVIYRVKHSAANGVPLGGEVKDRDFKVLFIDCGLVSSALQLRLSDLHLAEDLLLVNSGSLTEQFIGQHLHYLQESYQRPELYYWNREKKSSSAEVDYIISKGPQVIPVEVKAGTTGRLKSLQIFLTEKHSPLAIRFNTDLPSITNLSIDGAKQKSRLISLPLYFVEEVGRLIG